jgi:hypothetical protein
MLAINGHCGIEENNHNPRENWQLQVGFLRHQDTRVADPVFESFTLMEGTPSLGVDFYKIWGRFFSPIGDPEKQIHIPVKWASFSIAQSGDF